MSSINASIQLLSYSATQLLSYSATQLLSYSAIQLFSYSAIQLFSFFSYSAFSTIQLIHRGHVTALVRDVSRKGPIAHNGVMPNPKRRNEYGRMNTLWSLIGSVATLS